MEGQTDQHDGTACNAGRFVGRKRSYFLNRKQGEQEIFSFEDPILSLMRSNILGEKPPPSGYQPHLSEEGPL